MSEEKKRRALVGERAFLAEDAVYSKAQGYESLLCRDLRGPEPWQLSDITAASCFLREAEAINVSVRMISDTNTHVMLLGSNASKLVPCRGGIC